MMRCVNRIKGTTLFILAVTLLMLSASSVYAASWSVKPDSTLGFTGQQMGKPFSGSFSNFDVDLTFDPNQLEQAAVNVRVDMTSYDTSDAERDETLAKADWFNPSVFATATFSATEFEALPQLPEGILVFKAKGLLKIRDVEKPIEIKFTYEQSESGQHSVFKGETTLNRMDFELGAQEWRDAQSVGFEVLVNFTLIAEPKNLEQE